MTKTLFQLSQDAVEIRHLQYFAVVAEENNLHRAAKRLFMAQPPLSRQIKQLEDRLGVMLFERHSKGLSLTNEGAKVLEIIRPLLRMADTTSERLKKELRSEGKALRIGFTTAFEQGVFAKLEAALHEQYGNRLHIVRAASPKLAREVRKGKLDAALVALPLEAPGLVVREIAYKEPLVAAIPEAWQLHHKKVLPLERVSDRQLFWFRREMNPAFFDFTKGRFALARFEPHFIEEPAEHDVLLARIASGEGMGLFAASFAAIRRDGVVFLALAEKSDLYLKAGIITLQGHEDLTKALASRFLE